MQGLASAAEDKLKQFSFNVFVVGEVVMVL